MQFQSMHHILPSALPVRASRLPVNAILGLPVVNAQTNAVISTLLDPARKTVYFLNAHCANLRATNDAYHKALAQADYVLPDGLGVELAAKMQGNRLIENLNGTDFVPRLLARAASRGGSVFLLGGTPGTAEAAAERLKMMCPGLLIAGTRNGFDGVAHTDQAIDEINASGAQIVLVAMGVPKQELWIDTHRNQLAAQLVLGVGALFDFLAGNVRRAPRPVRRAKMEWLWRLAMEPRRMARRYLIGNVGFLGRCAAHTLNHADRGAVAQRALDLAIAGSAVAILALPLAVTAALVRLDSEGPALFRQTRVGKDGRHFPMLKFRSMHINAEDRRATLLDHSDREGICFKSKEDPRMTRIGKVLRRFSLDELPQLFNVLKGDMSIVGPRPALPEEVAKYPAHAMERLAVLPGITGLWQVSGRANIDFDKMIELDTAYVRSRSTLLNIILIALTFRAVTSGRGAY